MTLKDKCDVVLKYEERLAGILASRVLDKPVLSIWLILIPVLFIYHVYQMQRFKAGRDQFVENYLKTRKKALGEALSVAGSGEKPDKDAMADSEALPLQVRRVYADLLGIMTEHYTRLLRAEGETFEMLVRSAYGGLEDYLSFISRLARTEGKLTEAVMENAGEMPEGMMETAKRFREHTERLLREEAGRIFAV